MKPRPNSLMGDKSAVVDRAVWVSNTHHLCLRTDDEDGVLAPTMQLDGLGGRVNRPRLLPMVEYRRPESIQRAVILVSEVEGPLVQHVVKLGAGFPRSPRSFGFASRRGRRASGRRGMRVGGRRGRRASGRRGRSVSGRRGRRVSGRRGRRGSRGVGG